MVKTLKTYLHSTNHRRRLDQLLGEHAHVYTGRILDIGGKDRGAFSKPRHQVDEWVVADIVSSNNPDIVLDVCNMHMIPDASFDVVNATELFEHVEHPEQGLRECARVLKPGGTLIASMPFLFPIHADPTDFQRWTAFKWKKELSELEFTIDQLLPIGGFFMVAADMFKHLTRTTPRPIRWLLFLFYPLFDLLKHVDDSSRVQNGRLGAYTTGYFIVARK